MTINPGTPPPVDLIDCSEHCAICELHSNVEHLRELEIWRSRRWLLRHHPLLTKQTRKQNQYLLRRSS